MTAKIRSICVLAALTLTASSFAATFNWYVDVNAPGGGSGGSADPFQSLTAAFAAMNAQGQSNTHNIYVADGTYASTANSGLETFELTILNRDTHTNIYGGYAGYDGASSYDWTTRVPRSSIVDGQGASARLIGTITASNDRIRILVDGLTMRNGDAAGSGGAVGSFGGFDSGLAVNDCLFEDNSATGEGGAVYGYSGHSGPRAIENSDFTGNSASSGGAIRYESSHGPSPATISNCTIDGNMATGTSSAAGGGGVYSAGGLTIIDSAITDNTSASMGGAVGARGNAGTIVLDSVTVTGNSATGVGAVAGTGFQAGSFVLVNCLIGNNSSGGYAISADSYNAGTVSVNFCTIAENSGSGGILAQAANGNYTTTVRNSIVANNGATGISTDATALDIDYNDVFGQATAYAGTASAGANDLAVDPLFTNAAGDDFTLLSGGPCIDSADPAATVLTDLNGDPRPAVGGFDMGALEFSGAVCVSCPTLVQGILDAICAATNVNSADDLKTVIDNEISGQVVDPICADGQPGAGSEANCEAYIRSILLSDLSCDFLNRLWAAAQP